MTVTESLSANKESYVVRLLSVCRRGRVVGFVGDGRACVLLALALLGALLTGGCGGAPRGEMEFQSASGEELLVLGQFDEVYWGAYRRDQVECVLVAGAPGAQSRRILVVRSFWLPRKGRTPLTESGANLNIELLVESNGQKGLYRGAGFGRIGKAKPEKMLHFDIRSGTLRLSDMTGTFVGRLEGATVRGKARAAYGPERVRELADYVDEQRRGMR